MVVDGGEDRLFRALSAQSRRTILRLLGEQERTVNQVAQAAGLSVSLASRHLTFLSDLGLLASRTVSPQKLYSLRVKIISTLLTHYERIQQYHRFEHQRGEELFSRVVNTSSRRALLRLLIKNTLTVKELAAKSSLSVSLTSRHLKLAHDLGFLQVKIKRPYKYYSVAVEPVKQFLTCSEEVAKHL